MNNDIIGKEVVFYENNTWNHIIKEINLYTYTIEYGIKSGFSDKEQAEQSYFFFNEKFQKDIERIKRLTNIQYTLLWSSFFVTLRPNFHYRSYTLP